MAAHSVDFARIDAALLLVFIFKYCHVTRQPLPPRNVAASIPDKTAKYSEFSANQHAESIVAQRTESKSKCGITTNI
ncbi:MAG TPA: hypothetical protein DD383_02355 [Rikenellaceae bacterium]|nr:hypothetical protein [Rikenellaceae bacterium]